MRFLGFLVFFLVSHLGVSQILRFTTHHTRFWKALPLLVTYGAIVAWLLCVLDLHGLFFWHLILTSVWFFMFGREQSKMAHAMMRDTSDDADFVRCVGELVGRSARYYVYSSFVYVAAFASTYLWLYTR